jgi:hypothetical protein
MYLILVFTNDYSIEEVWTRKLLLSSNESFVYATDDSWTSLESSSAIEVWTPITETQTVTENVTKSETVTVKENVTTTETVTVTESGVVKTSETVTVAITENVTTTTTVTSSTTSSAVSILQRSVGCSFGHGRLGNQVNIFKIYYYFLDNSKRNHCFHVMHV